MIRHLFSIEWLPNTLRASEFDSDEENEREKNKKRMFQFKKSNHAVDVFEIDKPKTIYNIQIPLQLRSFTYDFIVALCFRTRFQYAANN